MDYAPMIEPDIIAEGELDLTDLLNEMTQKVHVTKKR
jgi:hypothetical protein